jgi:DNA-binding MarR family transcriptional regulator
MKYKALRENDDLFRFQTRKLQDLMDELLDCCREKTAAHSRIVGVPAAEMDCLRLFDGERYMTAKSIADKMDVAKSRVTKIVSGLVEKGLAERTDDPRDARVKLISLTASGRQKLQDVGALLENTHRLLLLQLSPDERKQVVSALEILRASMEAVKSTDPETEEAILSSYR